MAALDVSKNTIICHACAMDVAGEYVACQGFCNAVFHPKCCSTSLDLLKEIFSHRQTFWLCPSCSNLMADLRHRRSVQCAFEAGQELSLSHHNRIVEQLKTEILSELKAEISSNFAKLISSNSLTPRPSGRDAGGSFNPGGRRLFENPPNPAPKKIPRAAPVVDEHQSSSTDGIVAGSDDSRFWLYLSRVSRRVSEEQIIRLATDRLGVSDIKATRLVAKGRDVSRMKFISFKVGMKMSLKARALSPSTWPDGLVVREFEDRSSGNFWEPTDTVNPPRSSPLNNQQFAAQSPPPSATSSPSTSPPPNPTPLPVSTPLNKDTVSPMSTASSQAGNQSV